MNNDAVSKKNPQSTKERILETANTLFFTKSYENTSIQMIIDTLGIAKGTFYHHFSSKAELLSEIGYQRGKHLVGITRNIIDSQNKNAVQKFEELFNTLGSLKIEQMPYLEDLARVFYNDKNVYLREKLTERSQELVQPMMVNIIEQGEEEGVFHSYDSEFTAKVIFSFIASLGKEIVPPFLRVFKNPEDHQALTELKEFGAKINNLIERILGAEEGTLNLYNFDIIFQHLTGGEHDQT